MQRYIYYLPGIFFILFGLLIIIQPQILVAIVASSLILLGVTLLAVGSHFARLAKTTIFSNWRGPGC